MILTRKMVVIISLVFALVSSMAVSASALTVPNLYSDLSGTSSQIQNLANYASKYDSFYDSSYVGFRDSQYSYYLVWGDANAFDAVGNVVTSSDCSYVRYYRPTTTSDWEYVYIEDDTLSVNCDYLVTSNLDVKGFNSTYIDEWNFRHNVRQWCVLIGVFIVFGAFMAIRRN